MLYNKDDEFRWDAKTEPVFPIDRLERFMKRNTNLKYRNPYAWEGATGRETPRQKEKSEKLSKF